MRRGGACLRDAVQDEKQDIGAAKPLQERQRHGAFCETCGIRT